MNHCYIEYIERIQSLRPDNMYFNGAHNHHILPKCLGGTDDPLNLIYLTPQEHVEAHRLLAMDSSNGLLYYAHGFIASRVYGKLECSKILKEYWRIDRDAMLKVSQSESRRNNLSKALTKYFEDPEARAKTSRATSAGLLKYYEDPSKRELHKQAVTEALNRSDVRVKVSENTKAAINTPEVRARASAARKGTIWFNDGTRNYRTKDPDKIQSYINQGFKRGKILRRDNAQNSVD